MRFFRGIAIPSAAAEATILSIQRNGLLEGQGKWRMSYAHPGPLDALFAKDDLSTNDTRPKNGKSLPAVCACGELEGAIHYACKHNRTARDNTPVIVEFEADSESVSVDGRDFLYTTFQGGSPEKSGPILEKLFGKAILRYAEIAWNSDCQDFRISLCDLAVYDPEIIRAHHANDVVIEGRYGTVFRNAFIVKVPIEPEAVVRVWSPLPPRDFSRPAIFLGDVL